MPLGSNLASWFGGGTRSRELAEKGILLVPVSAAYRGKAI